MACQSIQECIKVAFSNHEQNFKIAFNNEFRDMLAHEIMKHTAQLMKEHPQTLDQVNVEFILLSFFDRIFGERT